MLDAEMLRTMKKHLIFATGILPDSPAGLNMMNTGKDLRWVACTGEVGDWAIYCHYADDHDELKVYNWGDKVLGKENINRCVKCTDDAINMYRR